MADLAITIANQVNTFGPAPSTKWATGTVYTMQWGVSIWGEGTEDLITAYGKNLDAESISLSDSLSVVVIFNKTLSNSVSPTMDMGSEELSQGGWNYVFVSGASEAEDRSFASYTSGSVASVSWSSSTATSTSWS